VKYLCLAYGDQKKMASLSKEQFEALVARCKLHDAELQASGHFLSSHSLEWDCTTIRAREGKTVVTDGPFVETKETVGGLFFIEARDLNEAIRIASLHPAAHLGEYFGWAIEVRPVAASCHQ
jgi:hypothetical protein